MTQEIISSLPLNRLVIIGIGLIGGSLAKAARHVGAAKTVIGVGRNEFNLKRAVELGVIDSYALDPKDAVVDADLVVIATPVLSIEKVLRQIADVLGGQTVVTDAGSAKGIVVEALKQVFKTVPDNFVPGHPIAGSEKSGIDAVDAALYQRHKVILTPLPNTSAHALAMVQ